MEIFILELITRYAAINDLDRHIVAGLIQQESGFNPLAVGDNGHSFGLMQLYDRGAGYGYSAEELLDPETNIQIGVSYLKYTIGRTDGTVRSGLSAYNQGVGGWRTNGPDLNAEYVDNVLANSVRFRADNIFGVPMPDIIPPGFVGKRFVVKIEEEL